MRRDALLFGALPAILASLADPAGSLEASDEAIRIREIHVPFSEFHARVKDDPRGVIMNLDEYRALVLKAIGGSRGEPSPPLPPIEATVVSALYRGVLAGRTLRVEATLKVRVAREGWTRCNLGPPLPGLGAVIVDDGPGWILLEDVPALPAQSAQDNKQNMQAQASPAIASRRAFLLLSGKGEHDVRLVFSVPASEADDRWSIAGHVVPSASSRIEIDVPGQVEARARPDFLETRPSGDRSTLILALGTERDFAIEWRRKRSLRESALFLAADHALSFLVRRENPVFVWDAAVTVARRKTDTLTFTEPPLARVVQVEGPAVQGWERTPQGIKVTLVEQLDGAVSLRLTGLLEPRDGPFELGPPALVEAFSNTGSMTITGPPGARLSIDGAVLAVEIAPGEAGKPPPLAERLTPARAFAFASSAARVTVSLTPLSPRHEARAAFIANIGEDGASLEGVVRVSVLEGRLYSFTLSLPAPWRLVSLVEVAARPEDAHLIRHEEIGPPGSRSAAVFLERGAAVGQILEVQVRLEDPAQVEDRSWARKPMDLTLPAVLGAEQSRTDLGIDLPTSMDALMPELPGWRSLPPEEVSRLGLDAAAGGRALVAGLTTRDAAPRLTFTLVHRPARGEYRMVIHLIALERQLRVRADLRLALVDRPLEELVLGLPPAAGDGAVILGEGIKEVAADLTTGRRTVRFSKPWLGTRQLRIEYETPHQAGAQVPIPSPVVGGARGAAGGAEIEGERFIVLQSRGPVEIDARTGPGLSPISVDELPDFAEAWSGGRVLTAYRFHSTGDPGTLSTVVHEQAPVLRSLAREVRLTTILGREGVSRTEADVLLAHSHDQHLTVRLPADARSLSVSVNDEPLRAVRPSGREISIPLPPQSYAQVRVVYERTAAAIGVWGWFEEEGPVFPDMPVGKTIWTVYYPDGWSFLLDGGDLNALDPSLAERGGTLAGTFLGRLFAGREWIGAAFREERAAGGLADPEAAPNDEAASSPAAAQNIANIAPAGERVAQALVAGTAAREKRIAAPSCRLIPEGRRIDGGKIGSAALLRLAYRSLGWWEFSKRTVFLATLFTGCFVAALRGRRAFFGLVLWGIVLGTLIPAAAGWSSPLIADPFVEALLVLFPAGLIYLAVAWMASRLSGRSRTLAAAALLLSAAAILPGPAYAQDRAAPPASGPPPPALPEIFPLDGVLIPYDPAGFPGLAGLSSRVYVPGLVFRRLWSLAFPGAGGISEAPPAELILGNAEYRFRLEGDGAGAAGEASPLSYVLTGSLTVNVLTERWVALDLPFDAASIVRVTVDGADAGVAQRPGAAGENSVPFIELKGRGARKLEVELRGRIVRELGQLSASIGILGGAAATLRIELPAGAKVEARGLLGRPIPVVVTEDARGAIVTADLGSSPRVALVWSFPKIEGGTGSQLESLSYTSLSLTQGGAAVDRTEYVRVTGRPVQSVEYVVHGGWRVTEVAGAEVSEWSLSREGGDAAVEKLQVFFAKPVDGAGLRIRGFALLEASAPLPTLALEGAVRQETLVGIHHGGRRRFAPQIPAGMFQKSREELAHSIALPENFHPPDRIYQTFGSAAGVTLATEAISSDVAIATNAAFIVEPVTTLLTARSRYTVLGPGPLRHEVPVSAGWSVRSVKCEGMRSWEVAGPDGARRLVIHFNGRAVTGTEVVWSAERRYDAVPDPLDVPAVRVTPAEGAPVRETEEWALAASDELDLAARQADRMAPVPLDSVSLWVKLPAGVSYRFAFRASRADLAAPAAAFRVAASRRPSHLAAVLISIARLSEEHLHVNTRIQLSVRLAGRERFRFALPAGAELVGIETRNQQSRDVRVTPAGTEVEIVLQSPAVGDHAIDVSYRISRTGTDRPVLLPVTVFDGGARLEAVDQYAAVLQAASTFISSSAASGLTPVEAETLPYLPAGVPAASLKPAYRATRIDWSLTLEEQVIEVAAGPPAVISLAEITTVIGGDGTTRTRAVFTVRNRGLQFLLVRMPPGSSLWGVALNGNPTAVGRGAAPADGAALELRVPVEHVGSASRDLEVAVQYEETRLDLSSVRGSASLEPPRVLNAQVVETVWNVLFPDGYWLSGTGGNMREVAGSVQYAKKVENLLGQIQKISKAANESDSQRLREQAARDMARLELTLGDNLAELEELNRSVAEQARAGNVQKDELRTQWAANDAIIERSQKAKEDLRQAREVQKKAAETAAPPSREEQSFQDTANYLKRSWEFNERAALPAVKSEAQAGRADLDGLLETKVFRGLAGGQAAARLPGAEVAEPRPVDGAKGLKPLPDALRGSAAPGLEAPHDTAGRVPHTFVHAGGDARLVLSYTRKEAVPRLAALAGLITAPILLLYLRRRGRKSPQNS